MSDVCNKGFGELSEQTVFLKNTHCLRSLVFFRILYTCFNLLFVLGSNQTRVVR